ncbi:hypothetical protein D3C71_1485040 [compost metagenome]
MSIIVFNLGMPCSSDDCVCGALTVSEEGEMLGATALALVLFMIEEGWSSAATGTATGFFVFGFTELISAAAFGMSLEEFGFSTITLALCGRERTGRGSLMRMCPVGSEFITGSPPQYIYAFSPPLPNGLKLSGL